MALTDYLKRRGHTYYVRLQIPKRLWPVAGGKREYVKSLKTRDLSKANQLKHAHVAVLQNRIRALERKATTRPVTDDPLADIHKKALFWRWTWEKVKDEKPQYDEHDVNLERPYYPAKDVTEDEILDDAREIAEEHGDDIATTFLRIARAEGTPLHEQVEPWLTEQAGTITEQTSAQHRMVLNTLLKWAGAGVLVEDVSRRMAGEFVSYLLSEAGGTLSRKTVARYASSLSSMWQWLLARGIATAANNPWRGLAIARKPKRGEAPRPKQWSDAGIKALLTGERTEQYTAILHDLVRLALVTGARLDELCALKVTDAHKRSDGWWIEIRAGKTDAAVREVPIHPSAAHVIERRCKSSKDGYLFEGLIPGGPDKKRSWNVSKSFGHYTRKVVPSEERRTFHALRNSFIEVMEEVAVPESTTQLLVGHKRTSLTYGHYSQGERLRKDLRKYIGRLRYSNEVMKLIRGGRDRKGSARAQRSLMQQRPRPVERWPNNGWLT